MHYPFEVSDAVTMLSYINPNWGADELAAYFGARKAA